MANQRSAKPFPGPQPYQQHAARSLPWLVRQAECNTPITYGDLARLIGIPNPRNLNFILGSVGNRLLELGKKWGETIPPIQALVVNGTTSLPGQGGRWFVGGDLLLKKSLLEQRMQIKAELETIYAYPKWAQVLAAVGLKKVGDADKAVDPSPLLEQAARMGGPGESEAHRNFKLWVARNPAAIGLKKHRAGSTERRIPSGDSVDVVFENDREIVAVEVKPLASNEADIARGLFQCLKYWHVLDAQSRIEGKKQRVKVLLALQGELSPRHVPIKVALGFRVLERVNSGAGPER